MLQGRPKHWLIDASQLFWLHKVDNAEVSDANPAAVYPENQGTITVKHSLPIH
jgi:hypothetical protein